MYEKLKDINLVNELDFTFVEVEQQLIEIKKQHGDGWKEREVIHKGQTQEETFFQMIDEYKYNYIEHGKPVPWIKIIGEAHIALVRQKKLSDE